ncbi:MAG: TetR/AcrR family transcriptional regulator [Candidatus Calescibacterium sp.]|nr:TetR/AcrR family transcriptional regulator [Candidatus Calescibacterium sp.]MCX7734776.1 TetR/AcrR family transcriptional regulator [bacterium]MDW8087367.1 TetR/AcrR family transcriptional regulator [Candidatus Calescibacterium sp.]
MRGRKSIKDEKRRKILELSKKVFAKYGFAKTTMEDIGSEIGFTAAAIYYYFESKDHLFKECIVDELTKVIDKIEQEIKAVNQPVEKLKKYIEIKVSMTRDVVKNLNMTKDVLEEMKGEVSKLGLKDLATREYKIIEEIMKQGMESNIFRTVEIKKVAFIINAIVKELISTEDRKKDIEDIFDIILRGIQK